MVFNVAKIASARASSTKSLTISLRVAGPLVCYFFDVTERMNLLDFKFFFTILLLSRHAKVVLPCKKIKYLICLFLAISYPSTWRVRFI